MNGAARLAARGALAAGAGKVSIAVEPASRQTADTAPAADPARPETMRWSWGQSSLARFDAVVAGCGLGTDRTARGWLRAVLALDAPLVLDADALTLIAGEPVLVRLLRGRAARSPRSRPTILTPHPLEAARLLAVSTAQVQRDRIEAARRLADQSQAVVVLKGAGTIVADPAGHWAINASGGPVLATGGTGDVLAGIIGALAAQLPAPVAACLGTWAHGAAGDAQARDSGPIGSPASCVARRLPEIWHLARQGKLQPSMQPSTAGFTGLDRENIV